MTLLEARRLRAKLGGLEITRTLRGGGGHARRGRAARRASRTASGTASTQLLGRSLLAQLVAVGSALALGGLAYAAVLLRSGLPEAPPDPSTCSGAGSRGLPRSI